MTKLWTIAACLTLTATSLSAQVAQRETDDLLDLLALDQTITIMRDEGLAHGADLALDMLPSGPNALWDDTLERIYDPARMAETVRQGFAQSFLAYDVNPDRLEQFFSSETGQTIVQLEVTARAAMSDPSIEDVARESFLQRRDAGDTSDARLAEIDRLVEIGDLIESNVVGGLNSTIRFYQGLADGGALDLTEDEILAEVWSSEPETRQDTIEWMYGFLLMAYRPLSDTVLADYTDLTATPEGRVMTRALFAGFDQMYNDISYALGRALARQMQVQDL